MIKLHEPFIHGNEWKYIKNCLDKGWVSSAGKYVDLFEKKIAKYTGSKYAIACINGTSALQLSLKLVGVGTDEEVIVPSMTFIAPVTIILLMLIKLSIFLKRKHEQFKAKNH